MTTTKLVELIENLPATKKKVVEDLVSALVSEIGKPPSPNVKPGFGGGQGLIAYMADDFDEPLTDFEDYM